MGERAILPGKPGEHVRYALLLGTLWTLLVMVAAVWYGQNTRAEAEAAALVTAKAGFEKDMLYRRWATLHGGLYAEISPENPPNPHLESYSERDLTTPSGRKLTLINPAYMTRQVFDLGTAIDGPRAHITSLVPIRGENAPDGWEKRALEWFSRGALEYEGVDYVNGVESARFMGALAVDASCRACHAAQGYQIGEVRGGISVSVPLAPYLEMFKARHGKELRALAFLWLIGVAGIALLTFDLARKTRARIGAERALTKSEDAHREVLANVSLLAVVLGPGGAVEFVNAHFAAITGYRPEEVVGRDWFSLLHPGMEELREDFGEAVRKGRVTPHHRAVLVCRDGSRRTVDWSSTVKLDDSGNVTAITSIGEDITERLAAEERRKLLATALDRAAEGVMLTDSEGRITYVNASFAAATGVEREAATAMRASDFLAEGNDEGSIRGVREAMAAGLAWERRLYCLGAGGRRVLCDVSGAPLTGGSGERVGYVQVARDVTGRIAMEERLAQAQRMEALGTLAGGIAHDFNNILTAMQGWAELTLLCDIDAAARENVGELVNASSRAAELVRQILAFSRKGVESEAGPMAPAPLIKEALKLIRSTAPANIALKIEVGDTPRIHSTPGELHRLVVNLCTNAEHAMERGGTLQIKLDTVDVEAGADAPRGDLAPGRYVRLTVKDEGHGMTGEVRTRIFEPFFTTKGEGKGTGMGLSVVHTIVSSRGGAIFVDSHPGSGSTFEVCFPALEGPALQHAATGGAEAAGPLRVMFVDDEHSVARLAERALSRYGHTVSAFTDPVAALDAFRADPYAFDAVITDMTMPGLRGDRLAGEIRRLRPDLPLILCTGYSEKIAGRDAASLGVDAVELKPLSPSQLNDVLARVAAKGASTPAGT